MQEESSQEMIVLMAMPKIPYIQMEKAFKEPHPGLQARWFLLKTVDACWTLDADEHIGIARRGFPLVLNFCTTIDEAAGQTLQSSIVDLGDFGSGLSYHAAMRGYMVLSRVTAAVNMFLARTFDPFLFRLGPQPFPSLLFQALRRELDDMPEEAFIELCVATEKTYRAKSSLKDALWKCSSREKPLPWTAYFVEKRRSGMSNTKTGSADQELFASVGNASPMQTMYRGASAPSVERNACRQVSMILSGSTDIRGLLYVWNATRKRTAVMSASDRAPRLDSVTLSGTANMKGMLSV